MKPWPLAVVALLGGAASAQDIKLTPLIDARVRLEEVDQRDLPRGADALTARMRAGVSADSGPWQVLVESEATLGIVTDFNTGTNGRAAYPVVADPNNIELNRAQLRYRAHGVAVTAGRQLLELADQRFVGSANWRQNQQTFDAARVQWGDPKRIFTDLTYARSARTVNGINGAGTRPTAVNGNDVFALAGAATPMGTVTGFAYLVDEDHDGNDVPVQGYHLASQTYGVRLTGAHDFSGNMRVAYVASWARQSDWHRNPNDYAADYWMAEATGTVRFLSLTGAYEVLGADDGRPLTSVQTPLASLFKFQGWADKFTTTPPNGVRDLYGTAGLAWKKLGPLTSAGLSVTYHRFTSDRLNQQYGDEWDLLASAKRGHTTFSARYARYRADTFAADADKFWLEADWAL